MDKQQALDSIAAKALLLEPGASFVVPVDNRSPEYLDQVVRDVEEAIAVQHRRADCMQPILADPDEIEVVPLRMTGPESRIIIQREA